MTDSQLSEEKKQNRGFLNVDNVFRKKGSKIYPYIPGFLIRYIERIVHQDELNAAITRLNDKKNLEFLELVLLNEFGVEIEARNFENLPAHGRFIIAGNHPLGGMDGMALMHVVGKKRPDLKFLANDILLEIPNLRDLFVPVNKHGRSTHETVRIMDALFSSDDTVLVFPAGLVSRKQKGGISDLDWKKTFITKAIKYERDIVPVHIDGENSQFFYNLARWRKRLRIKANIEMLYLADEMFKQKGKKITITFGEPVSYATFTRELTHQRWADRMKAHVYGLPGGNLQFKV